MTLIYLHQNVELKSKVLLLILIFGAFITFAQPVRIGSQLSLGIMTGGCAVGCVDPNICTPAGTGPHAQLSIFYNISVPGNQYISLTAQTLNCDPNGPGLDGSDNFLVNGVSQGPFSNDQMLDYMGCFHNPCPTPIDITIELSVNRRDEVVELDWTLSTTDPGGTCIALGTPITPVFAQHPDVCEGGVIDLPTTSQNNISGTWSPAPDNTQTTTYTFTPSSGNCEEEVEMTVTVIPLIDASFDYDDFCIPTSTGAINIAVSGGTFSFDPNPGNGATIDPTTGVISNALAGNYSIRYTPPGACPDMNTVTVTGIAEEDASFNFDNFCAGDPNGPTNIITSGGTFIFDPVPGDGATIDPSSGEITGGVGGATYTVRYTTSGQCPGTTTRNVTVTATQTASFTFNDFCIGSTNGPTNISPSGGTFSFENPPGDGATIDPNTGQISNATANTYDVLYTTAGPCPGTAIVSVTATSGPSGTLSGDATLCPGQCATFGFTFSSGTEPYTINLTASPPGIALPPIPGVSATQDFTICYGGTGLFPTVDLGTFTITIPTIFSGSGSLVLTGISDASGCPGTASGSFSLTLTAAPTANPAGPLTACADADGNGTFDLTSLDNTVNGGNSSLTVEWFEDMDATIPITNPTAFVSMGGTVYARVSNGSCESPTVLVTLVVETGSVPFISMLCAESGTDECTICVTNGSFDLDFLFGDNNTYTATVRDNNTGLEYSGQVSNLIPLTVSSNVSTTYTLINLQPLTGCPNTATYTDIVTINIVLAPDIDPVTIAPSCFPITLPPITGSNLSGNESYYTGPNGTGTPFLAGTQIATSQTLYIYDSNGGCENEIQVDIVINPLIMIDDILDYEDCSNIILPTITGTGVSPNAFFNTQPDGSGTRYNPGDIITSTVFLYVIDPDADPNCLGNSVEFSVTINLKPDAPVLTSDCTGFTSTLTITNLPQPDFSASVNGGPFLQTDIFTEVPNGTVSVVIRNDITGCESDAETVVLNCGCSTPAILNLPLKQATICPSIPDLGTLLINNLTFSSPTTEVFVTTNGSGTLSQTTITTSPSDLMYTISPMDVGRTISITFTTNDPDGSDPCGPTVEVFRLTILDFPNITINGNTEVCSGDSTVISINGLRNEDRINWLDGNMDNPRTFENITDSTRVFFNIIHDLGCTYIDSIDLSVKNFSAGLDSLTSFCVSTPTLINLNNFLSADAIRGGVWKSDIDTIFNFMAFPVDSLGLGNHIFRYIIEDADCGRDTALLTVNLTDGNNAGMDNVVTLCQTANSINLADSLGMHDVGGTWQAITMNAPNISNSGVVNINNNVSGIFQYLYIIPDNGCPPDTSRITLDIKEYKSNTPFSPILRCVGSVVDLSDILSTATFSGAILNVNNYNGLVGTMWNTAGFNAGTYTFEYLISNEAPCENSSNDLVVILQDNLNPGSDNTISICAGQSIDLKTLLSSDADPGGNFFYNNQEIQNGIFEPSDNLNTYTIQYRVGDGLLCPFQESTITVNVFPSPNLSILPANDVCQGDLLSITINHNVEVGGTFFFTIQNQNNTFSARESIDLSNASMSLALSFSVIPAGATPTFFGLPASQLFTLLLDSVVTVDGCVFTINESVSFNTLPLNNLDITRTICITDQFTINNEVFDVNRPNGTVMLPSMSTAACDTLANISLSFYPAAIGQFEQTFCNENGTINIGNETFNFTRPSGSVLLQGASANGCDSTVLVNLIFDPIVVSGSFTFSTCDESYQYTVGSEVFDINRTNGSVLLPAAAIGGCDSLVTVSINYLDFVVEYSAEPTCGNRPATFTITSATQSGPFTLSDGTRILGTTSTLPYSIMLPQGNYDILITTDDGCRDNLDVIIEELQAPEVTLTQSLNSDGSIQISTIAFPDIINSWSWSPRNTLSCSDCPNPIANPSETTTYTLSYIYGEDCTGTRQITLNRATGKIILPNIISLNSGINNSFYVTMPEGVTGTIKSMRIYDRWGNATFIKQNVRPNDPDEGWKCQFNGRNVASGVYVYVVEVMIDGQTKTDIYSGDITVIE